MDGQMKKGILEFCILALAAAEDRYGYEIARRLREHFPEVQESTVYAILRRLRAEGALDCAVRPAPGAPPRKYYRLTPQGRSVLENARADWLRLAAAVGDLCFPAGVQNGQKIDAIGNPGS